MEYHQNSDIPYAKETPLMKPQSSNWTSNLVVMYMLTLCRYSQKTMQQFFNQYNHPTQISNINNNEKHSPNELAKDNSVTKEADEGGAIVIFYTRDYINSCENLLSDAANYKKVQPLKELNT